jgi:hypothetical protein
MSRKKRKIFVILGAVLFVELVNFAYFVMTTGIYAVDRLSVRERFEMALSNPLSWMNPTYTFFIMVTNIVACLILVVAIVAFYFLYEHFFKNKKNKNMSSSNEKNIGSTNQEESYRTDPRIQINSDSIVSSGDLRFKKIVLWGIPAVLAWMMIAFSVASDPGAGMVGLLFLFPVLPIVYVFFPAYFIILSVRYSREKSRMHVLDKITFYILLVIFLFAWVSIIIKAA